MKLEDAEQLVETYLKYYGISHQYDFKFMQRRGRFNRAGQISFSGRMFKKLGRRKIKQAMHKGTIELQPRFVELNSFFIVKQVIIHEIAHALNPKNGHGKFFQMSCDTMGHKKTHKGRHTYYGKEVKHYND